MSLSRNSVELLAPSGSWEALEAAVSAGADAVYLGGKNFNMRLHRADMNFDDEMLENAVKFAHSHGVKIYVAINNLINENEIPGLSDFLLKLGDIKPDAVLVQDFAVIEEMKRLGLKIPVHSSVMMNIHSASAVKFMMEQGVSRIVAGRETTLSELSLIRKETGIELEYFVHGDMCIAESGQCVHSGVLFGHSSNRGRCLKPCRWPYRLIDDKTGDEKKDKGLYKLALNDMCMYKNIPDLIRAGIFSFKIEGRMRPPEFIARITGAYRRAIDSYIADPSGWVPDDDDWRELYDNRVRNFSTCFAFGQPESGDIGYGGEREPRFFSRAKAEPAVDFSAFENYSSVPKIKNSPRISVRASDFECAKAAVDSGAGAVYVGGDVYKPKKPWKIKDIMKISDYAHKKGALVMALTPRATKKRECEELADFLETASGAIDGVIVGNPGSLKVAFENSDIPIQTDFSFNISNSRAAELLRRYRVVVSTASPELSLRDFIDLVDNSGTKIEIIIHGAYESMIMDHDISSLASGGVLSDGAGRLSLLDEAGEKHPLRRDQHGRTHILFAKDLCLYQWLPDISCASSFRIEAQDYDPDITGRLTAFYREALEALSVGERPPEFSKIPKSDRALGIGAFSHK